MNYVEQDDQKYKLEEMIKRKREFENVKRTLIQTPTKEVYRYEELIRNKPHKRASKCQVFHNAFCAEIRQEEERILNFFKEPISKPEQTWYGLLIEKERKIKQEENRTSQERLKLLDKRTRYSNLVKEVLSPSTKSKNSEATAALRSASNKEIKTDEKNTEKLEVLPKPFKLIRRLLPRSQSKKEAKRKTRVNSPRLTLSPQRLK